MSELKDQLAAIDALKKEIKALGELSPEASKILWTKYRLEWNYNSNHIEGNTLTIGQTKALLILGEDLPNHNQREVKEMKAHDVAVELVKQWAAEDRPLSEADIRELSNIILVEPFYQKSKSEDGVLIERLITPGKYKEQPNHVITSTGEMFFFAEPHDVANKMEELIAWYRKSNDHPLEVAAKLHYDFVRIHPFDDGNGRVSRLLMNYHLLKHGYAPVIIKSEDKKQYFNALNQADEGNMDAFIHYGAEQLRWSENLWLKAGKGESLNEIGDVEKKIKLWKKNLETIETPIIERSMELIIRIYGMKMAEIFLLIEAKIKKQFSDLINELRTSYRIDDSRPQDIFNHEGIWNLDLFETLRIMKADGIRPSRLNQHYCLKGIRIKDKSTDTCIKVNAEFNQYQYGFSIEDKPLIVKKYYNEELNKEDEELIIEEVLSFLLERMQMIASRK